MWLFTVSSEMIRAAAISASVSPGLSWRDYRLADTELRVTALLVLGAGFETTVNLIGNAVALLLKHPSRLSRLAAEPEGWPNAVDFPALALAGHPTRRTTRVLRGYQQLPATQQQVGAENM